MTDIKNALKRLCDAGIRLIDTPEYIVGTSGRRKDGTRAANRKEISKAEREHTPLQFALWLIRLAEQCAK